MGPLTRSLVSVTVATALLVAGCGDESGPSSRQVEDPATAPSSSSPTDTPDTPATTVGSAIPKLQLADSGTELALTVGDTAQVFLPQSTYDWNDPVVDGRAVTISEDVSDEGSSSRSWTITAVAAGDAAVSVVGSPPCRATTPPCAAPDTLWSVRITVS